MHSNGSGFMPGIHVLKHCGSKGGDHRDKPGHDEDG